MKKLLSLTLALAMILSLAACGGESKPGQGSSAGQTGTNAPPAANPSSSVKFPTHTIEMHAHKSGTMAEINTRLLTPVLAKYLGVDVIVINDESMFAALQTAIGAEPDGYVLSSSTCNVQLTDAQGGLNFDSVDDGRFIATFAAGGGYFVALTKKFADANNVHTLDELVALTKAHPQEYTISTSYGAVSELATFSLMNDVGIDAFPVDLAEATTRLTTFIQGDLDIFVGNWEPIGQYVETGEVEVLCYYGDARSSFQPDIPCIGELGYTIRPAQNYYYITCADDTPDEIVEILTNAVESAVNDPEFIEAIHNNATEAYFLNAEDTYTMLSNMRESLSALYQ